MTHRILVTLAALAITTSAGAQQIDADTRNRQLGRLQEMRERAAGGRSSDGEAHVHDGFFFRADSGVGYMKMTLPVEREASCAGWGLIGALHIGGSIQERTILGAQAWVASIPSASVSLSGAGTAPTSAAVASLGLGPELTVYLWPSNVYFSASAGPTWLTFVDTSSSGSSDASSSASSKPGLGARIAVGSEWMLGRKVGLGLAAVGAFSSNKLTVTNLGSGAYQAWHAGLLASFTYN
jgi:hypothetical protein